MHGLSGNEGRNILMTSEDRIVTLMDESNDHFPHTYQLSPHLLPHHLRQNGGAPLSR